MLDVINIALLIDALRELLHSESSMHVMQGFFLFLSPKEA